MTGDGEGDNSLAAAPGEVVGVRNLGAMKPA
jgi:hypothetical protein